MAAARAPTSAGTARTLSRARSAGRQPWRSSRRTCLRRRSPSHSYSRDQQEPGRCETAGVDAGAAGGPPWPGGAAWIDGRYCPIEAAKISVLDLGVTRSDCTYDVVHVWEGQFFRLEAHL